MEDNASNPEYRAGIVAIVGRANVGKSTLLNQILGEKVSITSAVAQTTRNSIRGIHTEARGQLVFLDTPGVHKARHDLGKLMNKTARAAIEGSDVGLLVLDTPRIPRDEDEGWMRKLAKSKLELVFALNKEDSTETKFEQAYRDLWQSICSEISEPPNVEWVSISAATGSGVPKLCHLLFQRVPLGPPLFDEDIITDFPRQLAIADIVREKFFQYLKDELPHEIAVKVTDLTETEGRWNVQADILVNRQSQKGIVIGHKGRVLKNVTERAQKELSEMYDVRVSLQLWVKVEKDWARNFWILKQLGHISS
ncbi:MAG: GTPase Era [Verrucomicrobia bacterium]|nr:GTPase Era [Verrucomicrobiota bacterium]